MAGMEPVRASGAMRRFLAGAILALAVAPAPAAAAGMTGPRHSAPLVPPRDGNIAVAEELDAARRAGTVRAYDLFLARHPDHRLARVAQRERSLISRRTLRHRQ